MRNFQQILNRIDSKKHFLVDSLGALVSAIVLGLILTRFEAFFGMPKKELHILAPIAGVFFRYSFLCFTGNSVKWRSCMKIIAVVNLLYCCLTTALVLYLYQHVSIFGIVYFAEEIVIVTVLAIIELKTESNNTPFRRC